MAGNRLPGITQDEMDSNECKTMIASARDTTGKTTSEILKAFNQAVNDFNIAAESKFGRKGEW